MAGQKKIRMVSGLPAGCTDAESGTDTRAVRIHRWLMVAAIVLGAGMTGFCASPPELTVTCMKPSCFRNDTVILAVRVQIPDGYILIGNPKGPGIGRPLKLGISSNDHFIRWLATRKPPAKKYGPPFGDWVWGYCGDVRFFCTGVVASDTVRSSYSGAVLFEGLLCSSECRLESRTVPFTLVIGEKPVGREQFEDSADLYRWFSAAGASMPLDVCR